MSSAGTDFLGGAHPPEMICTPPEAFGSAPKSFCTPANYIYFDLIVSYLIILTTKFVKLPILWSQISPCRPCSLAFPGVAMRPRPKQEAAPPPRYLSTPERKYENPSLVFSTPSPHYNFYITHSEHEHKFFVLADQFHCNRN